MFLMYAYTIRKNRCSRTEVRRKRKVSMMKRTRASRIRIRFFMAAAVVLAASMIFFCVLVSARGRSESLPAYKYYTSVQIGQGDTLWGIAEEYCPRQLSVKSYVKELKQINRLKTDDIHAGNYLTVVYYSNEYK